MKLKSDVKARTGLGRFQIYHRCALILLSLHRKWLLWSLKRRFLVCVAFVIILAHAPLGALSSLKSKSKLPSLSLGAYYLGLGSIFEAHVPIIPLDSCPPDGSQCPFDVLLLELWMVKRGCDLSQADDVVVLTPSLDESLSRVPARFTFVDQQDVEKLLVVAEGLWGCKLVSSLSPLASRERRTFNGPVSSIMTARIDPALIQWLRGNDKLRPELKVIVDDMMATSNLQAHKRLVGFWHIGSGAHGSLSRDVIVQNQLREILKTKMFKSTNLDVTVRWMSSTSLSDATLDLLAADPRLSKFEPILAMEEGEEYYEYPTLHQLHSFCSEEENEAASVFYFHSKTKEAERVAMEEYVFDECPRCMEDPKKLVCGPNYRSEAQGSWCHFRGNFWMARCSHVKKLNPPYFDDLLDEAKEGNRIWTSARKGTPQGGWPHDVRPYGRFFAEYWMMNDQGARVPHEIPMLEYGIHTKHECVVRPEDMCTKLVYS